MSNEPLYTKEEYAQMRVNWETKLKEQYEALSTPDLALAFSFEVPETYSTVAWKTRKAIMLNILDGRKL